MQHPKKSHATPLHFGSFLLKHTCLALHIASSISLNALSHILHNTGCIIFRSISYNQNARLLEQSVKSEKNEKVNRVL
jgi:hypothetical protein